MNAFQRPAVETGQSIKKSITFLDENINLNVIENVNSIIDPHIVIFVSKLSWNYFGTSLKKFPNKIINYSLHPASYGYWYSVNYEHRRFTIINLLRTAQQIKL